MLPLQGIEVQSLVRELRFHKAYSLAKKKKKCILLIYYFQEEKVVFKEKCSL